VINKVILIGRLGTDPEVRYTQDGTQITNFRLATSEYFRDKNNEKVERTEWHRIVAFGKVAEFCSSYCAKGRLIYCEGKIQTREWEDKEGNKRYTTSINVVTVRLLERREGQPRKVDEEPAFVDEGDSLSGEEVPF